MNHKVRHQLAKNFMNIVFDDGYNSKKNYMEVIAIYQFFLFCIRVVAWFLLPLCGTGTNCEDTRRMSGLHQTLQRQHQFGHGGMPQHEVQHLQCAI